MSEYQYIALRAVDRPLTDAEMAFAKKQSTRAEISRWSFRNEYHYGDFRGDVSSLLRRGFDVYLHYANFGVRTAAFRLPVGLPFPKAVWSPYIGLGGLAWMPDREGQGGILSLSPFHDADGIGEIWSPGEYMDDLVLVRSRLVAGDLRALYAIWLCAAFDDQSVDPDVVEPPVPGGLADCVDAFGPFLEFFGLDPLILAAASERSPIGPQRPFQEEQYRGWVKQQSAAEAKHLLRRFLTEDPRTVKAETIAAIQQSGGSSDWPTASPGRTLAVLFGRTEQLRVEHNAKEQKEREALAEREAARKQRERQSRMQDMVKEPQAWLREATKLVDQRGTSNYQAAAEILADLRAAVGGDEGEKIARKHAAQLAKKHPTLNCLKSSLRKRGLLE